MIIPEDKMKTLNLEQHRARINNLREARKSIKKLTRELRIHNYLPGQVIYYLGDYPAKMSIKPTEYDFNLLKSYAENGVDMIQVHEEWNTSLCHPWSSAPVTVLIEDLLSVSYDGTVGEPHIPKTVGYLKMKIPTGRGTVHISI